jgi:hypothetical protein
MDDVARASRQHEIVQQNVIVGEILKRFGDRHLAAFADEPIATVSYSSCTIRPQT